MMAGVLVGYAKPACVSVHTQGHPPLAAVHTQYNLPLLLGAKQYSTSPAQPHLSKPNIILPICVVMALMGWKERGSGPLLSCRPRVTCWLAMKMLSATGLPMRQKSQVQGSLPAAL